MYRVCFYSGYFCYFGIGYCVYVCILCLEVLMVVVWCRVVLRLCNRLLLFLMFIDRCSRVLVMLVVWCVLGVIEVWVIEVGWVIRFFMLLSDLVSEKYFSLLIKVVIFFNLFFSLKLSMVLKFCCWCLVSVWLGCLVSLG